MIIKNNEIEIYSTFAKLEKNLPNPYNYLILRLLNISIMRIGFFREIIKQKLAKILITNKDFIKIKNTRSIKLGSKIDFNDSQFGLSKNYTIVKDTPFSAIHMASQGYWQIQDEEYDS